jgi:hypothetical protein
MLELFLLIVGVACLIWFRDSFKIASKSMEESSKVHYEKSLYETSQKRQNLFEEVTEDLDKRGLESYASHRDLIKLINKDDYYER